MNNKNYQQTRWSLQDLFPGPQSPQLEAGIEKITNLVENLEKRRAVLVDDISQDVFLSVVKDMETIVALGQKVATFAGLYFSEDTKTKLPRV